MNVNARINSQMIKSLFTPDKKENERIYHNESLRPPSSSIVSRGLLIDVGRTEEDEDGKMLRNALHSVIILRLLAF